MAKITQSLNSKTENTITMNWSSDSTVDLLWYSIDNGASWTSKDVASKKSGTYTIYGLRANLTYKIKTIVQVKGTQDTVESTALSVTTYNYPHCIDAPSFVIGDGATLKFYNPLNRTFSFTIKGNGQEIYTWTGKSGTSVSGVGGVGQSATAFYNSIPYLRYADYTVVTKYADSAIETTGGTYNAKESACEPTFSAFTYRDTNTSVVNVTGSDQVIVEGLSNVAVKVAASNKMVAKNGALPARYTATLDIHNVSLRYAETDIEETLGTVDRNGVMRIVMVALDTRGYAKFASKEIVVVPYAKPVVTATLKRKNNFEAQTTLTVEGTYSRVTVNGADKNQLRTVQYRYREKGGTWSGYVTMTKTASAGSFTCTDVALNLDNTKAYEFEVEVADKLGNSTETLSVDIGQAIFFISTNQKKCFVNGKQVATVEDVSIAQKSNTLVDVVFPVGSVYVTNTNTNPYKLLGRGAWTLIDKGFASAHISSTTSGEYFAPAENCVNGGTHIIRGGNSIRIRQAIKPELAMEDANHMVLGSFYWENIGVTDMVTGLFEGLAYADGANSGIVYRVAWDTGDITQVDTFDLATVPSDVTFYLDFTIVADKSRMIDSYCDKFYWKRTS